MKTFICILGLAAITMADSNIKEVFKKGNEHFTAKMFNEVIKTNPNESCVLSAFSVLSPLAQLALASVGPSHNEILKAIGMPNDDVTKEVFADVNTRLRSVKGIELKQANKVYVRDSHSLNDEFAVVSKEVFNSEVQNINFTNRESAANEINKWVEDHTNERIKNLLDPSALTADTAAVLVNAIYFKGKWRHAFRKEETEDLLFYTNKKNTVRRPMMQRIGKFRYLESDELNAQFLEMAYEGDETSFVVVLPKEKDGVDLLIEKLTDPAVFSNGLKRMYEATVDVTLPRFKIETTTNLKEILSEMNIKSVFSKKLARLDNLIKGEDELYLSDAVQKAFIEVNEEGAEAAAANYFGIALIVSGESFVRQFNANHPFLFFLMEKDNILFNGVYRS